MDRTPSARIALDARDLAILRLLQADNKIPQRRIAEAVALSAPAVQRRIKRMEAAGVIAANVAVVDPAMVDHAITVFVDYDALTRRLFFANNNVKRFRSFVSMDRVKVGLTIPLGDAPRA
jgi:predicted transcriptional regulator